MWIAQRPLHGDVSGSNPDWSVLNRSRTVETAIHVSARPLMRILTVFQTVMISVMRVTESRSNLSHPCPSASLNTYRLEISRAAFATISGFECAHPGQKESARCLPKANIYFWEFARQDYKSWSPPGFCKGYSRYNLTCRCCMRHCVASMSCRPLFNSENVFGWRSCRDARISMFPLCVPSVVPHI